MSLKAIISISWSTKVKSFSISKRTGGLAGSLPSVTTTRCIELVEHSLRTVVRNILLYTFSLSPSRISAALASDSALWTYIAFAKQPTFLVESSVFGILFKWVTKKSLIKFVCYSSLKVT